MFVKDAKGKDTEGVLVRMEPDEQTRFQFEIWFPYTRQAMNQIREGAMLAVKNFASNRSEVHYSILEVVSILPLHYAIENLQGNPFPGFVVEAARSASRDWYAQEEEPLEDTTKIKVIAVPTNLELSVEEAGSQLQMESNEPMLGEAVYLFDTPMTERIVNCGVQEKENIIEIGKLTRDENVGIKVRVEDLLRTHFGIFGYTGAGKSNLVSTIIRQLLVKRTNKDEKLKFVIFDLMGEYTGLMIDLLEQMSNPKVKVADALIVCVGDATLPGSVVKYLAGQDDLEKAANDLLKTMLLPKGLRTEQEFFKAPLRELLERKAIRIYLERPPAIGNVVRDTKRKMTSSAKALVEIVSELGKCEDSIENAEAVNKAIEGIKEAKSKTGSQKARDELDMLQDKLQKEHERFTSRPDLSGSMATIPYIINLLNDPRLSTLIIVQAHNPDELRRFAKKLGTFTYEARRQTGQIFPLVSFIFDEADEFIPQNPGGTYKESVDIAMTLARRGRKFGLGIGIATQRVRYLNTSIMAQPHTYFVSKLPRKTDREAVADAFGIGEDMFRQTFKFRKGDWLLVSHDATGLESIPLPIHVENAEEAILEFLKKFNKLSD